MTLNELSRVLPNNTELKIYEITDLYKKHAYVETVVVNSFQMALRSQRDNCEVVSFNPQALEVIVKNIKV